MNITAEQHAFAKTIGCPPEHKVWVIADARGSGLKVMHGDHKLELRMFDHLPGVEIQQFIARCHAYDEDEDER